jgi:hypothetical protein
MRNIFLILMLASAPFSFADGHLYEPVANKAEYYIGSFNEGKDMDDLIEWSEDFIDWQERKASGTYDSMLSVLLVPYFHNNLNSVDTVWLNIWPNATAQFKGLEFWLANGVSLLSELPSTNSQVVDTAQWPISEPDSEGDNGMVRFSDCKLKDGVTALEAFKAYKDFAIAAKATGDNLGRKMIFPSAGATEGDYDFVYSLYSNTVSELGSGGDNYWENINGTDADVALGDVIESCNNYRTFATTVLKRAKT